MRRLFFCSLVLLVALPPLFCQTPPKDASLKDATLMLRAERRVMIESVISDGIAPLQTAGGTSAPAASYANYHYDDECIAMFNDGSFRIERARHASDDLKVDVKVYEGRLAPQQLTDLLAILDSPEFQKINVDRNTGKFTYEHNGEQIAAWISRPSGEQHFRFTTIASRKQYSKALKPFLNWWHTLDKHRPPELPNATATGCKP